MITFAKNLIDQEESISQVLGAIFPYEIYEIFVLEYELVKLSNVIGESQFEAKLRINVTEEEKIAQFFEDFGGKSGTSYNITTGDRKASSVIVSGSRKCEHNVRRHHLKNGSEHSGPGRQPGAERQPGKNTVCPASLTFSLSATKENPPKNRSLQRKATYELKTK